MTSVTIKMLTASLINCHLMIADIILKNGYPIKDISLPNVMLDLLDDTTLDDVRANAIVTFLHQKGFDINAQVVNVFIFRDLKCSVSH